MTFAFDAYVTAALFDASSRAVFALGDGTVRFEDDGVVEAHDGAALAACLHPSGEGLLTGGDDGRLVWSRPAGAEELAKIPGRWIESVAASADRVNFSPTTDPIEPPRNANSKVPIWTGMPSIVARPPM